MRDARPAPGHRLFLRLDFMSDLAVPRRPHMVAAIRALFALMVLATVAVLSGDNATAQIAQPPTAKPEMRESCPGLIASQRPRATPASLRLARNADEIRVNYIGHSTFLIESPQGVRIATEYNDYVKPSALPDIATLNPAQNKHYPDR